MWRKAFKTTLWAWLCPDYKWKVPKELRRSWSLIDHLDQCLAKGANKYVLNDRIEWLHDWVVIWMSEGIDGNWVRNDYKKCHGLNQISLKACLFYLLHIIIITNVTWFLFFNFMYLVYNLCNFRFVTMTLSCWLYIHSQGPSLLLASTLKNEKAKYLLFQPPSKLGFAMRQSWVQADLLFSC